MNTSLLSRFLLASSLALALPFAAEARPMGDGPGRCGGPMAMEDGMMEHRGDHGMRHMLRDLDLSEAQKDKIFTLMHEQAPAMRDKAKELRATRQELHELARSGKYDEAKVNALTEKSARAMTEMARMRVRTEHEIYQMLTPEQRKQLDEKRAKWQSRRGGER